MLQRMLEAAADVIAPVLADVAVTSARRLKQLPDVPTMAEQLPGFEG